MRITDLRQAPPDLLAQVLAANAAVSAQTSELDADRLSALLGRASCAPAAVGAGGRLLGFVIGLGPGAGYDSPHYRWFSDRYDRFAYVDRVVTAPAARGRGVARALYAAFAAAMPGEGRIACEVNLLPPNPPSDAFHAALGFVEVGQGSPAPGKVVRYLLRPLAGLSAVAGH